MHVARRVSGLRPYVSARIGARTAAARAGGRELVSLATGTHDLPTAPFIVAELIRAASDPDNHTYADFYGLPELRVAVSAYYRRRFGVDLDPDRQVLPLIGAKDGIAHLPWAVVDPGDRVLLPDPGFPVYRTGTLLAGGTPVGVRLRPGLDWRVDFDALDRQIIRDDGRGHGRPRLLWLNYPANPTGAVADLDHLGRAVRFATEHGLLLAYDNTYAEITFDGFVAPSVLQIPGAARVAVEFGSLSATYNMSGWRVGWMVGNPAVVEALGRLKTNIDAGVFKAIQWAGVAALESGQEAVADLVATYRRRRNAIVDTCTDLGWKTDAPRGSTYLWLGAPPGETGESFAARLVDEAGVVVAPGSAYGNGGSGHVRLTLAVPDDRLAQACARLHAAFG